MNGKSKERKQSKTKHQTKYRKRSKVIRFAWEIGKKIENRKLPLIAIDCSGKKLKSKTYTKIQQQKDQKPEQSSFGK